MTYWLFLLLSSALCGVTVWQLRFSDSISMKHAGASGAYLDKLVSIPKGAEPEIWLVEREVDEIEQQGWSEWRGLPITLSTRMDQVRILGKLLLFDKNLSVNRNEACSFCHMSYTDLIPTIPGQSFS